MELTGNGLVQFAYSKIGIPYVYGAKGSVMTYQQIKSLQNTYGKDCVWDSDLNKAGQVCCDCSGLISWYTGRMLGSSQLKSDAVICEPISTIASAPIGATVWKQGHVGVYIGNGEYIAEDGSRYGCRKNNLSNARFTHWLLQSFIDYSNEAQIIYKAHVQGKGWLSAVSDGQNAGTTGQSRRLEAVQILTLNNVTDVGVIAEGHVQSIGWQGERVVLGNNYIGTVGESKRLEAVRFRLFGQNSNDYTIQYRVHIQNLGWSDWKSDWKIAGTTGKSLRLEAIEINVIRR